MHRLVSSLFALLLLCITALPALAAPPDEVDDITSHLEFMGYDVTVNQERLSAKHGNNPNILLKKFRGGILISGFYTGTAYAKSHRSQFMATVNNLNNESIAGRFYVDKDGDLVLEGYYPGPYNKKAFSAFMDNFNQTNKLLSGHFTELKDFIE